jgi:hypothetical protein
MRPLGRRWLVFVSILASCCSFTVTAAQAGTIYSFTDVSGLAAEAEFTIVGGSSDQLDIRLRNTSTGVPVGFDNADQILTGVSWDFGDPGFNGDVTITGGSVVIGPSSGSLDFDTGSYGPGADVSGEYGYGNMDGTGALTNFVSALTAVATPFGGANLDGPASIDGPQGGLVADPAIVALGGLGAIQDEVLISVMLSGTISQAELDADLSGNGVRFEFGSDALFFTVPEPSTAVFLMMGLGGLAARRRRSRDTD